MMPYNILQCNFLQKENKYHQANRSASGTIEPNILVIPC